MYRNSGSDSPEFVVIERLVRGLRSAPEVLPYPIGCKKRPGAWVVKTIDRLRKSILGRTGGQRNIKNISE